MKNWEKEAIVELLEGIDFAQCQKAMIKMNWTYGGSPAYVPSVKELKKTAKDLLKGAIREDLLYNTTGRFHVVRNRTNGSMKLLFSVSYWWVDSLNDK